MSVRIYKVGGTGGGGSTSAFGGFSYNVTSGTSPKVPVAGEAIIFFSEGASYEIRINYITADGIDIRQYLYFTDFSISFAPIIIKDTGGSLAVLNTGSQVYNSTYVTLGCSTALTTDTQIIGSCSLTFAPNPAMATINGLSVVGYNAFNIYQSMTNNLNSATFVVGTSYIGFGSITPNATENKVSVIASEGLVNTLYLRTAGVMTGKMDITLMKNGVATSMTISITAGSVASKYTTTSNQVSLVRGDEVSFRIVQTTATSTGVLSYGLIKS